MRHWLFHPLIFYPLMAVVAVALVFVSMRPDLGVRPASGPAGTVSNGAVTLVGAGLSRPDVAADQVAFVVRDGLGRPTALRIAVVPNQPPPGPAETGARLLLTREAAALIGERPVEVEIAIRPLPVTTAVALAVSLQGAGPTSWETVPVTPASQTIRVRLPATFAPEAIGLRAISAYPDYNYGFEIARIRIIPAGAGLRN